MSDPRQILTGPFRITTGDYFGTVLRAWLVKWGWMMLLPTIVFLALALALSDERWLIVALLVVFIIAPMVMSMVYTNYMLTPQARRAILPMRAEITPGHSLRLIQLDKLPSDDEDDECTPTEVNAETIPWSEILGESLTATHRVYRLAGLQFILIPHRAVQSSSTKK